MVELITKKITISGLVQGVGYRCWVQKLCKKYNIRGWVLNKKNGEVEVVLIDFEKNLFKTILSKCFLGPKKSLPQSISTETISFKSKIKNTFEIKK